MKIIFEIKPEDLAEINNAAKGALGNSLDVILPNIYSAYENTVRYSKNIISDYLAGNDKLGNLEPLEKPLSRVSVKENPATGLDRKISVSHPQLEQITQGQKEHEFDMKKKYPYGRKSRVSKDGTPYLIIPFRWGTPNGKNTKRRWNSFIPQNEYNTYVKGMSISKVYSSTHGEQNYNGDIIQRAEYKWKDRITKENAWSDNSVGMVRMKDVKGSTYWTFRIISAKSPANSWIRHYPAKPGRNIQAEWDRIIQNRLINNMRKAIPQDLK